MNFIFDAFISYGRADSKVFATKLNERLTTQGLNVWFDQEDIPFAVDFQEQINDGIEKAHNFIFIIAPHSVNSPYCLKEIELAIKHNKRIIPLLHVEEISRETWHSRNPHQTEDDWKKYQEEGRHSSYPKMHLIISQINWIYFREKEDNFESSLNSLFETIYRHKDYVEQHTNLLIKGLDWDRNQQQTNYLLVGEERQEASAWLRRKFDGQPPCIPNDLQCEFISESTKNANNLMTQVFLAYSDKDEAIKEKIRKTLMRESLTIWTNKTDIKIGIPFQKEINQGIEGADNFVYLISPDSLVSQYCQQELAWAFANNKRIIPLLIEDMDLELIPSQVRGLHFIDLTSHEDPDKYQIGVNKLLAKLKENSFYYEKHKTLLVKALKWQRQNHNPSLLLRGYSLEHFEAWLKVAKQRNDYPPLPLQEEFITASLNQPEAVSLEVFISYSQTDSDLARKLNDGLQELGKTTWFDQESIVTGTDFKQEIQRGIESSDNFLFIISPKSINSPYCADEVEYAKKLGKRFVTILHRPLSDKDKQNQPAALANVQYLDFYQDGMGEFAVNFNELVRTLETDRDHVRSHTEWSQKALKWERMKQDEALLLRGIELVIAQNWLFEAEKNNKKPLLTELQKEFIAASIELDERLRKQEEESRQKELEQEIKERNARKAAKRTTVGALIAIIFFRSLGLLQAWEWALYDHFFRLRPTEPLDSRIVIVGIDEADLQKYGFPINDGLLAELLYKLNSLQPRAIGLDIYSDLPQEPGYQKLVTALESIPNIIGIEKIGTKDNLGIEPPAILHQKQQVGFNNLITDADGKIRRGLLYMHLEDGDFRESFPLKLALTYLKAEEIKPKAANKSNDLQLGLAVFNPFERNDGAYIRADAGGYQFLANPKKQGSFHIVTMNDLLSGNITPNLFKDKIILIGYTALSVRDFHINSYSTRLLTYPQKIFGVELQANFLSQILSAALDGRANIKVLPEPLEWLLIIIFSWLGASLTWQLLPKKSIIMVLLINVSITGISYVAFIFGGWWLPAVPFVLAFTSSALVIMFYLGV